MLRKMNLIACVFVAIAIGVLGIAVQSASAAAIPVSVGNYSFEDAGSTPMALTGIAGGWTLTGPALANAYSQSTQASDLFCRALVNTPTAPNYGLGGPPWTGIGGPIELSQTLTTNYAANTVYALTVAIGGTGTIGSSADRDGGAYDISLYAGTTALVSGSNANYVGSGTATAAWSDVTLSYDPTAPGAPIATAGDALKIVVRGITAGGQVNQAWTLYDNVRLTSETIPEPSTLALLATGLIGLLAYAWRKRR